MVTSRVIQINKLYLNMASFNTASIIYNIIITDSSFLYLFYTGRKAKAFIDTARANIAAMIGSRSEDIIFTSGGTEVSQA